MGRQKETIRTIDGKKYRCLDLGCEDLERASRNRLIVSDKLFTVAYILTESALQSTPLTAPLPGWITIGRVPQTNGQNFSGGQGGGFHEEGWNCGADLTEG